MKKPIRNFLSIAFIVLASIIFSTKAKAQLVICNNSGSAITFSYVIQQGAAYAFNTYYVSGWHKLESGCAPISQKQVAANVHVLLSRKSFFSRKMVGPNDIKVNEVKGGSGLFQIAKPRLERSGRSFCISNKNFERKLVSLKEAQTCQEGWKKTPFTFWFANATAQYPHARVIIEENSISLSRR